MRKKCYNGGKSKTGNALVSKRVYKEKMAFEDARKIIMEGSGKQFDRRLLVYFETVRPKIEAYYASFSEK